jgi:hypothetical protein
MAQGVRIGRMTGKTRRTFLFANVTRPQDHHFPHLPQWAAPKPPVINCVPLLRRTRIASEGSQESFAHTLQDKTLDPDSLACNHRRRVKAAIMTVARTNSNIAAIMMKVMTWD